ncbi:type VII toxin-antitoxin system MntA family adenylyltransferase antitoxin [Sporosarcina cyprini]|uniref:type VII toxin-antitoxin system MntA family adenylyltransferase antitoxin n=1 Tax=Sporosarcina cyprini TaxID=2910523 RepID=UPI001EDDEA24|nr:nucleotidyltransferase domain-containing protein [Sporosarcina cyprini]MCG3086439.1 nucleotidyltransferase domain-containing protein [Sporosarcina cyprini]
MLSEEIRQQLVDTINEHLTTDFIILFGSFSKGTARQDSDIDVAYFSPQKLSSYEKFILAGNLTSITGREVDLVDLKQIDTVFTMQIFSEGEPIYIRDENQFTLQKMRAYSMYAALNEQRAPIIEAIKERGSVFGDE